MGLEVLKDIPRPTIKEKMFQEVFYSKALGGTNMIYQNEFKRIFPNVFKMILEHRREFRAAKKEHLSYLLMRLESDIIQGVLRNLFDKGYCVLNIHDAIVVLDTEKNIHLKSDEIEREIKEGFQKYHLYSSTKTDYYVYV